MRLTPRYLILGVVSTFAPFAIVVSAPPAKADCVSSGGTTLCSQGESRGSNNGNGPSGSVYTPYPCENDWYCGTDWDLDVDWNPGRPGIGGPGRPGGGGGIGPRR